MRDTTARLASAINAIAPVSQRTAYRDRNVFRPEYAGCVVTVRTKRMTVTTIARLDVVTAGTVARGRLAALAVQAEYRASTGKRISLREAKALLAIRRAAAFESARKGK